MPPASCFVAVLQLNTLTILISVQLGAFLTVVSLPPPLAAAAHPDIHHRLGRDGDATLIPGEKNDM